ncbi:Tkl protein kinase, partial [Globisporangium polare]
RPIDKSGEARKKSTAAHRLDVLSDDTFDLIPHLTGFGLPSSTNGGVTNTRSDKNKNKNSQNTNTNVSTYVNNRNTNNVVSNQNTNYFASPNTNNNNAVASNVNSSNGVTMQSPISTTNGGTTTIHA